MEQGARSGAPLNTSTGQPTNIKAIPTRYKGYHFRSRLEARFAVFLDALGEPWEYEPQGFEFPDLSPIYGNDSLFSGKVMYLPDFWLPRTEAWVEIKGPKPNDMDIRKLLRLGHEVGKQGHRVRMIVGSLPERPFHPFGGTLPAIANSVAVVHMDPHSPSKDRVRSLGDDCRNGFQYGKGPDHNLADLASTNPGGWPCWTMRAPWHPGHDTEDVQTALSAARSARFEHGHSGAS